MTHTCQFCQNEVPYSNRTEMSCDFYICHKCPGDLVYIYSNAFTNSIYLGYIIVVDFNGKTYHMDFMATEAYPFVLHSYDETEDRNKTILSLNYVPPITPNNALSWLEKLLNLKAFS